jgi:hypothetical protein
MSNPASMPWIKFYTRILDHPRFNRLSDSVKWRYVQATLLAGKLDAGGALVIDGQPLTDDEIAYQLRIELATWETDAQAMIEGGILHKNGRGYELPQFMDEQGPSQAEKRKAWKERQDKHRAALVTGDTSVSHALRQESESDEESDKSQIRQESETDDLPAAWIIAITKAHLSTSQEESARVLRKILGSSGLGDPMLLETSVEVAMRIFPENTAESALACLAKVYSNDRVRNKPVVAAKELRTIGASPDYLDPATWTSIPAPVLAAAGIDDLPAYILKYKGDAFLGIRS